jgi:outer membrane protein OmpA-like peptidoglycan-associated protein
MEQIQQDLRSWTSQAKRPTTAESSFTNTQPTAPPLPIEKKEGLALSAPANSDNSTLPNDRLLMSAMPKPVSSGSGSAKANTTEPTVPTILPRTAKKTSTAVVTFANASSSWAPAPRQAPYWLHQILGAKHIVLTGTSKSSGSRLSNEQLALARATTLRNYLIHQGVSSSSIEMKTFLLGEPALQLDKDRANFQQVRISWRP